MSERVLITGAGGFIGGRIAEVLHCSDRFSVRAGIRRWSTAARIARFPMEIVMADDEPNRPRSKLWIALVVVPVFYVLSIGPVFWVRPLIERDIQPGNISTRVLKIVYAPLLWLNERVDWFLDFLNWYVSLLP